MFLASDGKQSGCAGVYMYVWIYTAVLLYMYIGHAASSNCCSQRLKYILKVVIRDIVHISRQPALYPLSF